MAIICLSCVVQMTYFFEKYPKAGAGARAREEALEHVRNNIRWRIRNAPTIQKWLKGHFSEFAINNSMSNSSRGAH